MFRLSALTPASSAILAVGFVAFYMGAWANIMYASAVPRDIPLEEYVIHIVLPLIPLVLCYISSVSRNTLFKVIFFIVTFLNVPLIFGPIGDGSADISQDQMIRFAEAKYTSHILSNIYTVLFVICSVLALMLPRREQ